MMKIILILVSLSFAKVQGEKVNRAEIKRKIMTGCLEMSTSVADKKKAICKCILDNFDKKLNDHQLKILSENYTGKVSENADKELPSSALASFDYEVATECMSNPNWRIKE